jgi:hypothetical protein
VAMPRSGLYLSECGTECWGRRPLHADRVLILKSLHTAVLDVTCVVAFVRARYAGTAVQTRPSDVRACTYMYVGSPYGDMTYIC